MSSRDRVAHLTEAHGVTIETFVDGEGPSFVILPSYGRDGGDDFDDLTAQLVSDDWRVLRPQPRGVGRSKGQMVGLSLHDLASDVVSAVRALGEAPAVMLGHAFGNQLTRVIVTDYPNLVTAVVLAAAGASGASQEVNHSPFVAGDLSRPEAERLAALKQNFFAPAHDARSWLVGWHPETLKMQRDAAKATDLRKVSGCGSVPVLQLIAEYDPFNPPVSWGELRAELGSRVTPIVVTGASHALFPEEPLKVAEAVLPWVRGHKPKMA